MNKLLEGIDFSLKRFETLCNSLNNSGYQSVTMSEYLVSKPNHGKSLIIRHDVDRRIDNAVKMAELESHYNINSTYYFRFPYTFNVEKIRLIQKFGHEIGYHYEVLAKTKGNIADSLFLFSKELAEFRKHFTVKTICMHGSPLSRFDNRDMWKNLNFNDYDIVGDAYLSIIDPVDYLTDTGRSWNSKHSIRDYLSNNQLSNISITTTDQLIQWIHQRNSNIPLYLTVHPERWGYTLSNFFVSYAFDHSVNIGKKLLVYRKIKQ